MPGGKEISRMGWIRRTHSAPFRKRVWIERSAELAGGVWDEDGYGMKTGLLRPTGI